MISKKKPKDTLRVSYVKASKLYTIYFEANGNKQSKALSEPVFDITGAKMKKRIESLALQLERYGISREDLEQAIIKACNNEKIKPPKCLR